MDQGVATNQKRERERELMISYNQALDNNLPRG